MRGPHEGQDRGSTRIKSSRYFGINPQCSLAVALVAQEHWGSTSRLSAHPWQVFPARLPAEGGAEFHTGVTEAPELLLTFTVCQKRGFELNLSAITEAMIPLLPAQPWPQIINTVMKGAGKL